MPKVRLVVLRGFCIKFHKLSSSAKVLKIGCDKVTESLKVGTFLRHSVVSNVSHCRRHVTQAESNEQKYHKVDALHV